LETLPLIDRLTVAVDTLGEVGQLAIDLPEEREKAVEMALHMTVVRLYLTELASHLVKGMEPYDAVLAAAKGEMKLPESPALTTLNLLRANPKE
jgi:hypothetical protein